MTLLWMAGAEVREANAYYDVEAATLIRTDVLPGSWSGACFGTSTTTGSSEQRTVGQISGSEIILGGRWYFGSGVITSSTLNGFGFTGVKETPAGSTQCSLHVAAGQLKAYNGAPTGTFLADSGFNAVVPDRWYYIEIYVKVANSGGRFKVWVDGDVWIDFTGDTQSASTSAIGSFVHGGSNNFRWDDLYALDPLTGSAPWNDRIGDAGIQRITPNAAGAQTGWTPSAGSNFQNVDETTADGDTTYNGTSASGTKDLYNCTDLDGSFNQAIGVTVHAKARKASAGAGSIQIGVKYDADGNGTADTEDYATAQPLSTGYAWHRRAMETQPDASAWSSTKVNALQIGAQSA